MYPQQSASLLLLIAMPFLTLIILTFSVRVMTDNYLVMSTSMRRRFMEPIETDDETDETNADSD